MYQTVPVVAGTGVLGVTIAQSPLATTPVGRGALAVTGITVAAYVAVAVVLILVGLALRLHSRFVSQ